MKRISVLVPESCVLQAISGPQYLFSAINQFQLASGNDPLFEVELVSPRQVTWLNNGMFSIKADRLLEEVSDTDLVIIPALLGDMPTAVSRNLDLVPWIKEQYYKGAEVASLCVGAFLLAKTGLLNGKKCSTHWGFINEFRELYPEPEVVDGSIVTEDEGIYTSGGANSYWNLLLHLVEKYAGRETAILASKYFAIDIDRDSQSAFAMFKGQKNHNDDQILKAQEFIEKNIQERICIDELASMTSMGRRSFERRFRQATNNSVLEYIQRVKIESAKRQFEMSRKNISEVMYEVGYTDSKAFRDLFKKLTGLTPIEYRNKYNKMAVA